MSRLFVGTVSCLAATALLSLGEVHAQGRGPHAKPPEHPAAPAPSSHAAKRSTPKTNTSSTVAQRVAAHPELAARLQPLVPQGMTLDQAAKGFRNEGQFIAALHVSHNLDIPFEKLKDRMTGADHEALGQAIHDLKPDANAKDETRKAETEAKDDLKAASKKKSQGNQRDAR